MTIDLEFIVVILTSVLASSGFWIYVQKRQDTKDQTKKLLIGLAHDRIVHLAAKYVERGSITHDEYENLCVFLYTPYIELGGNGAAKRLMEAVDQLPLDNERSSGNVHE